MVKDKPRRVCRLPGCGRPLPEGAHGAVAYCPDHQQARDRLGLLRKQAARGDQLAADEMARIGRAPPSPTEGNDYSALQRFAVLLGQAGGNVQAAAQLAGLALTGKALEEYAQRAQDECPEFVAGKQTAAVSVANSALLLTLIKLRDSVHAMPAASLASTLRQLGETLDRLQGGLSPVYSEVAVEIRLAAPVDRSPIIDVAPAPGGEA